MRRLLVNTLEAAVRWLERGHVMTEKSLATEILEVMQEQQAVVNLMGGIISSYGPLAKNRATATTVSRARKLNTRIARLLDESRRIDRAEEAVDGQTVQDPAPDRVADGPPDAPVNKQGPGRYATKKTAKKKAAKKKAAKKSAAR